MARAWTDPRLCPYPPLRSLPAGICDCCSRPCAGLHQAGSVDREGGKCLWCHVGHYRNRGCWRFTWCHACDGSPGCGYCFGTGVVATPRD